MAQTAVLHGRISVGINIAPLMFTEIDLECFVVQGALGIGKGSGAFVPLSVPSPPRRQTVNQTPSSSVSAEN